MKASMSDFSGLFFALAALLTPVSALIKATKKNGD